jgi:hypothetical protein
VESDAQPEKPEQERPLVLLTGATGYIGSRLLPLLEQRDVRVRCLARKLDKLRPNVAESTEIVEGDVLDRPYLDTALSGVTTAYYLVHLMASSANYEKQDREAAENFGAAAKDAGVQRIIYMGGLGEEADPKRGHMCLSMTSRWLTSLMLRSIRASSRRKTFEVIFSSKWTRPSRYNPVVRQRRPDQSPAAERWNPTREQTPRPKPLFR